MTVAGAGDAATVWSTVKGSGKILQWSLFGIVTLLLLVSGIHPYDRLTWLLETGWVPVGLLIIAASTRCFPLSPLLYVLLSIHAMLLIQGGYYTYERVPLGDWLKDWFGFSRNHYDRIGHFFQGFVPAILLRELLVRKTALEKGSLLFILVCACCLAFSSLFELLEWLAALLLGSNADAFLATQGDLWDTQWDMFMALVGSMSAQLLLGGLHDRQLAELTTRPPAALGG